MVLKPVIQEEATGCGIASVANILGMTYSEMKATVNALGIHAEDKSLWSDTQYVRRMLSHAGVETSFDEIPFESWSALPDLALLSIKHHQEDGKNFWHWVVFRRVAGEDLVLDPASYLPSNIRTDFNEMQPKWFIEVKNAKPSSAGGAGSGALHAPPPAPLCTALGKSLWEVNQWI